MSRTYRTPDYLPPKVRWLGEEQIGHFARNKGDAGLELVKLGALRNEIKKELTQPVKDNQIIAHAHDDGTYYLVKIDLARSLLYYPTEDSVQGKTDRIEFERRGNKLSRLLIQAEIDLETDVIAGDYINV